MAADSDGCAAVVTCEGDLNDPRFPRQLELIVDGLETILGDGLNVCKLEPWNSVRVTLSVPRQAALRLRQLAADGQQQLRALGILSVQVEGDQVISLRLNSSGSAASTSSPAGTAAANSEPQEVIIQTIPQDDAPSQPSTSSGSGSVSAAEAAPPEPPPFKEKVQFRSPNVVCPTDTTVPKVPIANHTPSVSSTTKTFSGPFPFTSMNQAITGRSEPPAGYTGPPPPYPGKNPVTISSPLLVNLLQNEGAGSSGVKCEPGVVQSKFPAPVTAFGPQNPPVLVKKVVQAPAGPRVPLSASNGTVVGPQPHLIASQRGPVATATPLVTPNLVKMQVTKSEPVAEPPAVSPKPPAPQNVPYRNTNPFAWDSQNLQDLTPSLTELKADDLDSILPSLEHDLNSSDILEELVSDKALPVITQNHVNNHQSNVTVNSIIHNVPATSIASIMNAQNQKEMIMKSAILNHLTSNTPSSLLNATNMKSNSNNTTTVVQNNVAPLTNAIVPKAVVTTTPEAMYKPSINTKKPDAIPTSKDGSRGVNFLINPLTGELEPHSSSESEPEDVHDVFTGLSSPAAITDDDTTSTIRPDTTDQSDSETRSSLGEPATKFRSLKSNSGKNRDKGRDSPKNSDKKEKIKLRLKLEKTEPVNHAYKVDVSFVNSQAAQVAKKVATLPAVNNIVPTTTPATTAAISEELRVPPLHISLRGRNAVINNKKKAKVRKLIDNSSPDTSSSLSSLLSSDLGTNESVKKSSKKGKLSDYRDSIDGATIKRHNHLDVYSHYKDKHKERRGSDSELVKSKLYENSTVGTSGDKKRRLSQCDEFDEMQPLVLGSTNTGTIPNHKIRKEKVKTKDGFKSKDATVRSKKLDLSKKLDGSKKSDVIGKKSENSLAKKSVDITKKLDGQIILPTGDVDMEAKIKQRLLEDQKQTAYTENNYYAKNQEYKPNNSEYHSKPQTEYSKGEYNIKTQDYVKKSEYVKSQEYMQKEVLKSHLTGKAQEYKIHSNNNTTSNGNGKSTSGLDELIETLSDDVQKNDKCNTPELKTTSELDVKTGRSPNSGAQGEDSGIESMDALSEKSPNQASQSPHASEIIEKNKNNTSDLLDIEAQLAKMEGGFNTNDTNVKTVTDDNGKGEPVPVRIKPALYTYSNPEKGRSSPGLSDTDEDDGKPGILQQLLIEIPETQAESSPSPATRSLRTRASSKLSSPELLASPVLKQGRGVVPPASKRKRHESEGSNASLEDIRAKKTKKSSDCDVSKRKKVEEESSDSDEPLIEVAGKVRSKTSAATKGKMKAGAPPVGKMEKTVGVVNNGNISTRRSVRGAVTALNTRSKGDKSNPESDVLRRKTRSAVSENEGRRKRDIK